MIYRTFVAFFSVILGVVLWLTLSITYGTLMSAVDPVAMSLFPDTWTQWKNGPIAMFDGLISSWFGLVLFIGVAFYLMISAQKREPMWGYEP